MVAESHADRSRPRVDDSVDGQRFAKQSGLNTRCPDAGFAASAARARGGRRVNTPLQFGQRCSANRSRQSVHHVHSNEQIHTSNASGARSRSQHSQLVRISSSGISVELRDPHLCLLTRRHPLYTDMLCRGDRPGNMPVL